MIFDKEDHYTLARNAANIRIARHALADVMTTDQTGSGYGLVLSEIQKALSKLEHANFLALSIVIGDELEAE